VAIIAAAVVAALILLGALLPSEGTKDETASPAPPPPPAQPAEPPPPAPPAAEVDTGRMSDGEFELFSQSVAEVDDELGQFGEMLPKCAVFIRALQLSDASDCLDEAYSGVEEDMLGAYAIADDTEGDVAKTCRRRLRGYKSRLDAYHGYTKTTVAAGSNLQFEEFSRLANRAGRQSRLYRVARDAALAACAPV
jgi:hypothetical protein